MAKKFVPQNINFMTTGLGEDCGILAGELLRIWSRLNCNSPPGCAGFLKYYNKTSLNLFPAIPEFQVEFGQTAHLPIVKISDFGVLGLDEEWPWIYLTNCTHGSDTLYKATCMQSYQGLAVGHVDFKSVVHFDLSFCENLLSGHLEQVAIVCPNLKRLSLQHSSCCLTSLQGMQSIATNCDSLQGLNLMGITEIEGQVQLWELLSNMRLTHLALELCLVEPSAVSDRDKLIILFAKFLNLKALEFDFRSYCKTCNSVRIKEFLLLSHFPSLEFCMLAGIHPTTVQDIISSCKQLKYLNCSLSSRDLLPPVNDCNLQELCICSKNSIPDAFLCTISAHGGLVRVVLDADSVTSEGISVLIANSPNLLMFHIFVTYPETEQENLPLILKEKFCRRKLFTMGSCKVERESQVEYELDTNLLSLWYHPFWVDAEYENIDHETDALTTVDFDKYPDPYLADHYGLLW